MSFIYVLLYLGMENRAFNCTFTLSYKMDGNLFSWIRAKVVFNFWPRKCYNEIRWPFIWIWIECLCQCECVLLVYFVCAYLRNNIFLHFSSSLFSAILFWLLLLLPVGCWFSFLFVVSTHNIALFSSLELISYRSSNWAWTLCARAVDDERRERENVVFM